MSWINTNHPEDWPLGKVNKLKGMALEKAVSELVKQKYSAKPLTGKEDSIKEVNKTANDALDDLLQVKSTFFIKDSSKNVKNSYPTQSDQFDYEEYLLDLSDFDYPVELRGKKGDKNASLGYKGCEKCGYCVPEKFCKKCGGAVFDDRFMILRKIGELYNSDLASKLYRNYLGRKTSIQETLKTNEKFSFRVKLIKEAPWNEGMTKIESYDGSWGYNEWCNCSNPIEDEHSHAHNDMCPSCRSSFKTLRPGFNFEELEELGQSLSKSDVRELLIENGLVTKGSANRSLQMKRLDSWLIEVDSKELFITESKNYEKTALGYSDVAQVLSYVDAVRKTGFVKPKVVNLIYNGKVVSETESDVENLSASVDFDLNLVSIKEFCRSLGKFIDSITVSKAIASDSSGEYGTDVSYSDSSVDNPQVILYSKEEEVRSP